MNDKRVDSCFSCGAVIPPGFAEASCPACLMELAVHGESSAGSADDLSASQARTSVDVPFTGEPLATGIDPPLAPPRPRPKHQHGPARTDHVSGQLVSHYKLLDKIGEGGMGVVWSAEDAVLKRTVAIKFLPQDVAAHADRLARFEREARVLASLNHPHVSAIYGLEKDEADRFLVLEHVDGVTLDERIAKGLTQRDALKLAGQIALGLAAAHDKGILHRDLKPANVKVTSKGQAKVLDFGLAKALHPERQAAGKAGGASQMKTATMATAEHVVVGTAPYMSPEQSSGGQTVDKRTDIWAFGCVLYEMLSGKRAFAGDTVSSTIRAIHGHDPDWDKLPADTPRRLRRLLKRCLEKDPERRLHDISDARLEIDDALIGGEDELIAVPQRGVSMGLMAVVAAASLLAGGTSGALMAGFVPGWSGPTDGGDQAPSPPVHFTFDPPDGIQPEEFRLSPDGRYLVFAADDPSVEDKNLQRRLYLHRFDRNETAMVPGSEGLAGQAATNATFSPDSQWLAFPAAGHIYKVPVDGSAPPMQLVPIPDRWTWGRESLAWLTDDEIICLVGGTEIEPPEPALLRIPANGDPPGRLVPVTLREEDGVGGPFNVHGIAPLPDGRHLSSTVLTTFPQSTSRIGVIDTETGLARVLLKDERVSSHMLSATGDLVYRRNDGTLLWRPIDMDSLEPTGEPVILEEPDASRTLSWTGTLAYRLWNPQEKPQERFIYVDQYGDEEIWSDDVLDVRAVKVSHDGSMLAAMVSSGEPFSVYVSEVDYPALRKLGIVPDMSCGWAKRFALSSDGDYLAFWCEEAVGDSEREGIWLARTDGSGAAELLVHGRVNPRVFSADGRWLLFTRNETLADGSSRAVPFLQAVHPEDDDPREPVRLEPDPGMTYGQFSPDGRWFAYWNGERDQPADVYLREFRDDLSLGPRVRVTQGGVLNWTWAKQPPAEGMEILYVAPDFRGMSIAVRSEPTLALSEPVEIMSRAPVEKIGHADVLPDRRFLSMTSEGEAMEEWRRWQETEGRRFHVVLNWTQGLRDRLARDL